MRARSEGEASSEGVQWCAMRATLVLPVYNEAGNLGPLLEAIEAARSSGGLDLSVLAVNDGSADDSLERLAALRTRYSNLDVIDHQRNRGMAAALRTGFRASTAAGAEAVVCMDADLTHDPADLPTLLAALESGADLVIGSRYVRGGRMESVPALRVAISKVGNAFGRMLLGVPVLDMTSGYRAYRRSVLDSVELKEQGFGIQLEAVAKAHRAGFRLAEVPITLRVRAHGYSKMVYNWAFWRSYLGLFARLGFDSHRLARAGHGQRVPERATADD